MKKNAWARYWIRVHEIFVSGSEGNKWVEKYYYVLAVTGALMLSDEELKKQKTNPLFKDRPAEKIVNALQAEKYLEAYMFNKKKRLNYG